MSKITRQDFVATLADEHATLDVRHLDQTTRDSLESAGIGAKDLAAIAGQDGIIDSKSELSLLFNLIDDLDRNGSRHSIETQGTLSGKALSTVLDAVEDHRMRAHLSSTTPPSPRSDLPWLNFALGELGQKEIQGKAHNERILEYHHSVKGNIGSDETPWCSSFVNWSMEKAGIAGTDSAKALSWMTWGKELPGPAVGSIAVLDWGNGKGHVGFVVGQSGDKIVVAGGNQHNEVRYSTYTRDQIASFRVPTDHQVKPGDYTLPKMNVRQENENIHTSR